MHTITYYNAQYGDIEKTVTALDFPSAVDLVLAEVDSHARNEVEAAFDGQNGQLTVRRGDMTLATVGPVDVERPDASHAAQAVAALQSGEAEPLRQLFRGA